MLVVEGIRRQFAGIVAVDDASIEVNAGESVGLVGPNGSGKSTLLNIVSGFESADRGRVTFDGRDLVGSDPWDVASCGLRRTFQHANLPARMSVMELMLAGHELPRGRTLRHALFDRAGLRREERGALDKAWTNLRRLRLDDLANHPAGKLSGGQQKLLSLGMALMGDPVLLMLDEPTAGVNPSLRVQLAEHLRELQRQGMTLLTIEHDMRFIADTCDRVYVLDKGRLVTCCPPSELHEHPEVLEAYLGTGHAASVRLPREVAE
jgi:branched-chain amino acid transport system ATP-binding protein